MSGRSNNWPFVLNLGNSIIGVSILAMPYCFKQCGILLGSLLLLCSAYLTRVSCNLLLKTAFAARKRSYEFLALHTFGAAGKLAVELSIIGLLLGTCVAFYVIIGDLGPAIIAEMTGLENTASLRAGLLVFVAIVIVTPLGMMRDITSFTAVSTVSLLFYSVFITEVLMWAIPNLVSGAWIQRVEMWRPAGMFQCLPIFSMAFACQTQLFVLYGALDEPSVKRMNNIVQDAINMVGSIYLCVGFFGYVAFCELVKGDVLLNFSSTFMAEVVKMGFCLSVAVSFPLMIFPCRQSIDTLFFRKHVPTLENIPTGGNYIPPLRFKAITMGIIVVTLLIGIVIPNIETVLALTGATTGVLICFIFPSLMFLNVFSAQSSGKITAQIALFVGVSVLVASTYTTLTTPGEAPEVGVQPVVPNVPDFAVRNANEDIDKNEAVDSLQSLGGGLDRGNGDHGGGEEKGGEEHGEDKEHVQVDIPDVKAGEGKADQEVQIDKPGEKDEEGEEKDRDDEEEKGKDDSRLEPPVPHEPKEPKKDMEDGKPDNPDLAEQWEQHHKDEEEKHHREKEDEKDEDQEGAGKDAGPDNEEEDKEDFEGKKDDKEHAKHADVRESHKDEHHRDKHEAEKKDVGEKDDDAKEAVAEKEIKDKKEAEDKEHEDEEEKDEEQKKQLLDIIQKQQEQQEKLLNVQQQLLDELKEHKAKDAEDLQKAEDVLKLGDGDHIKAQAYEGVQKKASDIQQQGLADVGLQQQPLVDGDHIFVQQQAAGGALLKNSADVQQQLGLVDVGRQQPVVGVDLQQKGVGDVLQQGHLVDMGLQQKAGDGGLQQGALQNLHQPADIAGLQPVGAGDGIQRGDLQQQVRRDLGQQQGNIVDAGLNAHDVMVNNAALEVAELNQGIVANAGIQQGIADVAGIQQGNLVDVQPVLLDNVRMDQGIADGKVNLAKQAIDPPLDVGKQLDQGQVLAAGIANNADVQHISQDKEVNALKQNQDIGMQLDLMDSKKAVEKHTNVKPAHQGGLPDANLVHHRVERDVGAMEVKEVPIDDKGQAANVQPDGEALQIQPAEQNQQEPAKAINDNIVAEDKRLDSNNNGGLVKKEVPEEEKLKDEVPVVNKNQMNRDLKYHATPKPAETVDSKKGLDVKPLEEKIIKMDAIEGGSIDHGMEKNNEEHKVKYKEVEQGVEDEKGEKWDFNNYKKEENMPVDGNNNVDMMIDGNALQKDLMDQAQGHNLVNIAQVRDLKAHSDDKKDDHRKEFRK